MQRPSVEIPNPNSSPTPVHHKFPRIPRSHGQPMGRHPRRNPSSSLLRPKHDGKLYNRRLVEKIQLQRRRKKRATAERKSRTAREHAIRYLTFQIHDYPQWFPGEENWLADSLSRDHDLSDDQLTHLIVHSAPSQIPQDFNLAPLPDEIVSSLTSTMQRLPAETQEQEQHQPSKFRLGAGGKLSSNPSTIPPPHSSTTSTSQARTNSSAPSPKQSDNANFLRKVAGPLLQERSSPLWTTWLRPSPTTTTKTQGSTSTVGLADFYANSSKATKKMIRTKCARKQSLSNSSSNRQEQKPNRTTPRHQRPHHWSDVLRNALLRIHINLWRKENKTHPSQTHPLLPKRQTCTPLVNEPQAQRLRVNHIRNVEER